MKLAHQHYKFRDKNIHKITTTNWDMNLSKDHENKQKPFTNHIFIQPLDE